jgi:hypothetical protein
MVPPPADGDAESPSTPSTRNVSELSEDELYGIVRVATEDAVLGALGTLMLVGIGIVLIATGAQLLFALSPLPAAIGVILVLFGAYLALSSLRIVPPAREWL